MPSHAAHHADAATAAEPVRPLRRARPALHAVAVRPAAHADAAAAAWQAQCAARICACDASIDADDAGDLAAAMWTLERWQRMAPDAAVDALFGAGGPR